MKFYSTIPPLGGKPLDDGARANESLFHRVFSATPRVRVCARARARERRSSLCAPCTQIASDYLHRDPLTSGIRSPFIRAAFAFPTQQPVEKRSCDSSFLPPPSSFSSFSSVSLSTSDYSLPRQLDLFAGSRYN